MKEAFTETLRVTFDGKFLTCELLGDVVINVEHAEIDYEASKKITEGKKFLSLVLASKHTSITREAQKSSMKKEKYEKVIAQAIVIRSLAQRILGNFMILFIRYPCPAQLFNSKEQAVKWLNLQWKNAGLN